MLKRAAFENSEVFLFDCANEPMQLVRNRMMEIYPPKVHERPASTG